MADFLSGYNTRKKLTVDNTKISADLFDFPTDVILRSTNFDFTKSADNGFDVRFCEANGITQLDFERERHDNIASKAEYKTRLPFISSAAPTDSFIYYKNDPSIPDGQNSTAVWDANTKARWSLKEDPSGVAPQMKDSTINANHGTSHGAMTSADSVEGKISRALEKDGVNDYVDAGNDASLNINSPITYEAWVNPASFSTSSLFYFMVKGMDVTVKRGIGFGIVGTFVGEPPGKLFLYNANTAILASPVLSLNKWQHVVATDDGTTTSIYIDGALSGSGAQTITNDPNHNFWIGSRADSPTHIYSGIIDETRISNIARPPAWIKATFNSGNDTLLTYGAEEAPPSPDVVETDILGISDVGIAGAGETDRAGISELAVADVHETDILGISDTGIAEIVTPDVHETDIIGISDEGSADSLETDRAGLSELAVPDVHAIERIGISDVGIVETPTPDTHGIDQAGLTEVGGLGGVENVGILEKIFIQVTIPTLPRFPAIPSPMFPVVFTPTFEVETINYVGGTEQRIIGTDEAQYRLGIRYIYLDETEKNSILAFFIARKGQADTFYWVDPTDLDIERAYIVRFEEDMLNQEYFAARLWQLNEIDMIETYWHI